MRYLRHLGLASLAVSLCLVAAPAFAQEEAPGMMHNVTVRPAPTGVTPRTPDGHPDFTGVWNGMADNLLGVPNQMHNEGIAVENDHSTYDVLTGAKIATWPLARPRRQNGEQSERAATLLRRMGASRPIYKPEYWDMVKQFDANANEEDPSNNCMPAGVPRVGSPSYIGQFPKLSDLHLSGPGRPDRHANDVPDDPSRWPEAHAAAGFGRELYRRRDRPLGWRHVSG